MAPSPRLTSGDPPAAAALAAERLQPEWLERIRRGDSAAFEALFRAYAPGLCAFVCRYVQSREVAEELVQDLFLSLWCRRAELVLGESFGAYLYRGARLRALSHLRHERVAAHWQGRDASSAAVVDDPAMPGEGELLELLDLQDAIERLPARCRLVFTMSRRQGLSYAEIASGLGLSVKTVEVHMGRALRALRAALRPGDR